MAKQTGGEGSVGWESNVIQILNVAPLFPDEKMKALANLLPGFSDTDENLMREELSPTEMAEHLAKRMASFRVGVLNAAGIYRLNLHYDMGPRGSDRRRVLADMICQAKALERAIEALDPHSRNALEAAADLDPNDPGLESPDLPDPGRTRVRCAEDSLPRLQRWAETALRNTKPSPRGRRRQDAEREVVTMLRAVWEKQPGKSATLITPPEGKKHSPFLSFCQQVLWLISDEQGVRRSDLTKTVQDVLYPGTKN